MWHQLIIPYLDRQRLLGAHRELCALRGKGWGRRHAVVNYVFTHDPAWLVAYHKLVMDEMERRGYHPDRTWDDPYWRGSTLGREDGWADADFIDDQYCYATHKGGIIYPEHDKEYLIECLENLKEKGVDVSCAEEALACHLV